jgi:hypothetical protein
VVSKNKGRLDTDTTTQMTTDKRKLDKTTDPERILQLTTDH